MKFLKIFPWFAVVLLNIYGNVDTYAAHKTVELAVFFDQYLYHYWFTTLKRSSSTMSMEQFIRSYLDVLLESLNLIYAHPSLASSPLQEEVPIIGFHLAHSEIFWKTSFQTRTRRKSILEEGITAGEYLEIFCDFANKANWNGNRWDHALLLTGVDLKFENGRNYSVAGISWDNSMCNRTYSCSVVEGKTFRSVMTTVHEIGHSLGMEHDGRRYNHRCDSKGYIMSYAGGGPGKIAWSSCSKSNLKAFLRTSPNVLSNQVECLNNKPEVRSMKKDRLRFGKNLDVRVSPGKRFSVGEQCRMGEGGKWRPSARRSHIRRLCAMLYCNNIENGNTVPFHPALEGTPCGRNKICKYGECVPAQKI